MTGRDDRGPWHLALWPAAVLVVFFVVPFAIMLAVSFFRRIEGGFFEPAFELSNYFRFLSPFFGKILATSVGLSVTAAIIVVALAFPFTYLLSRMHRKFQTPILVFILSVLSLSEVIIGFAWSTLLSRTAGVGNLFFWIGLSGAPEAYTPGLASLLLGLTYLAFPYAVLVIYPGVSRLDPELRSRPHVRRFSAPGVHQRDTADHAPDDRRRPGPRIRVHAWRIPATTGPWATPALDTARAHHGPSHLSVQYPVRGGNGHVPASCLARARRSCSGGRQQDKG